MPAVAAARGTAPAVAVPGRGRYACQPGRSTGRGSACLTLLSIFECPEQEGKMKQQLTPLHCWPEASESAGSAAPLTFSGGSACWSRRHWVLFSLPRAGAHGDEYDPGRLDDAASTASASAKWACASASPSSAPIAAGLHLMLLDRLFLEHGESERTAARRAWSASTTPQRAQIAANARAIPSAASILRSRGRERRVPVYAWRRRSRGVDTVRSGIGGGVGSSQGAGSPIEPFHRRWYSMSLLSDQWRRLVAVVAEVGAMSRVARHRHG